MEFYVRAEVPDGGKLTDGGIKIKDLAVKNPNASDEDIARENFSHVFASEGD